MSDQVDAGALGELTVLRILEEFDGPKIIGVRSNTGQVYLGYWIDRIGGTEEWLFVPMSATRYAATIDGAIDLRSAILKSESGSVARVRFGPATAPDVTWQLTSSMAEVALLPETGEGLTASRFTEDDAALVPSDDFLSQPQERATVAELVHTVRAEALESNRERLVVRLAGSTHEVAARALSQILVNLQLTVEGLAGGRAGLNVVATSAASFDLELASAEAVTGLLGNTKAGDGLEALFDLMQARANEADLRGMLSHLPRRTAGRYLRLVKALKESRSDAAFVWGSPGASHRPVRVEALSMTVQGGLAELLAEYDKRDREPYTTEGFLQGLHLRHGTFELLTNDGPIAGKIGPTALEQAQTASMNRRYRATIQETAQISGLGREKVLRTLLGLDRIEEPEGNPSGEK